MYVHCKQKNLLGMYSDIIYIMLLISAIFFTCNYNFLYLPVSHLAVAAKSQAHLVEFFPLPVSVALLLQTSSRPF